MTMIPGTNCDISFGEADAPPVDWREGITEQEQSDEDEPTPDERESVIGMLGFDPREVEPETIPQQV